MKRLIVLIAAVGIGVSPVWAVQTKPKATKSPEKPSNPLKQVAGRMRGVEALLKQAQTDHVTQTEEDRIIEDLEKLIRQLDQQNQSCRQRRQEKKSSSKQQKKSSQQEKSAQEKKPAAAQAPKPAKASGRPGKVPAAVEQDPKVAAGAAALRQKILSGGIQWGNLPPRARKEIFQLLKEDIPDEYKTLLILYFKALSEKAPR